MVLMLMLMVLMLLVCKPELVRPMAAVWHLQLTWSRTEKRPRGLKHKHRPLHRIIQTGILQKIAI